VETKGVAEYSVQDFDAVEFMDESAGASLQPVPPPQSSVTSGASSQAKSEVARMKAYYKPRTRAAKEAGEVSVIAACFRVFAVISLIAAALAIVLLFSENSIDKQQGAVLLPAAITSGLFCLAVAKIIQCLHESSQRLQRIEKLLERR
jgi:hypothetical protein